MEKTSFGNSHEDFDKLLKSLPKGKLGEILDSIQSKNAGISMQQYQTWKDLNASLHDEGDKYRGTPASTWPSLNFNWDYSWQSQRYALDGVQPKDFQVMHPNGLALGNLPLENFDRLLTHFSRRDTAQELWELGCAMKLAKNIAYIRRGFPLTPPIAELIGKEVILCGGHHRYAIAKAVQLETIPILVGPSSVPSISRLLDIAWATPTGEP